MNKLTAEKCRSAIESIKMRQASIREEIYLQALEIALPVLEQQESTTDTYRKIENDDWIEWKGGDCPVDFGIIVEFEMKDGEKDYASSTVIDWTHENRDDDIIAYRVIENDGREG